MNNLEVKSDGAGANLPAPDSSKVLYLDGVCKTSGFVHNQSNRSINKLPNNVRFVVQPVPQEEVVTSSHNEELCLHPSVSMSGANIPFADADSLSPDDVYATYSGFLGSDPQAQLTVRSMASIGLGSSDGRKIHLRRVDTTGAEPLLTSPNGDTGPSRFPFPSLNITVNGKSLGEQGAVEDSSSDSDSDASSFDGDKGKSGHRHRRTRAGRKGHHGQGTWGSRIEFLLACVGLAAGLGNMWRFPYTAYKNGGGAFLIPYCLMVFLCGIPLQLLELAVGQYTREGPVEAMRSICPLFSGVGVGMALLSMLLSSYYSVAMAWSMLYLGTSFTSQLPWTHCNNPWNTENCLQAVNRLSDYGSSNLTTDQPRPLTDNANWSTPGQEYFDRRILQMTNDVNDIGSIQWELGACLLVAWVLLYVTLRKSVRWSGKFVYVTATLPYVLLMALTARALTLEGADDGLRYFFHPDWSLFLKSDVWVNALAQTFMSMGIAFGCLMAFASYNRFRSPFVRDGLCLSALNSITSLVVGIIVFAALGHTASVYDVPIEKAATDGLGFSLVMYSTVVSQMPFSQFWAVFLFVVFIFLGLDTQFATVEVVRLTLQRFVKQCCNWNGRCVPDLIVIVMCLACFAGSLPYVTKAGIYLMHLTDYYVATLAIILLALIVAIATGWVYGAKRLNRNIREMTAHSSSPIVVFCWICITPLLILAIWIFHMIDMEMLTFNHDRIVFPFWTIIFGWSVVGAILSSVPVFAIVSVCQAAGESFGKKLVNASKSQMTECPCCRRGVRGLKDTHSVQHLDQNVQPDSAFAFAEFAEITFPEDGTYTVTSISSLPATFSGMTMPAIAVNCPSDSAVNRAEQRDQHQLD